MDSEREENQSDNENEFVEEREVLQEYVIDNTDQQQPDEELDDAHEQNHTENTENAENAENEEEEGDGGMEVFEDDSIQGCFLHTDSVFSVSINPSNPDMVITGGSDDKAIIWSISKGDSNPDFPATVLEGHTDTVVCTAFNFDGSLVATGSLDSTVKIWNTSNRTLVTTLEGPGAGIEWVKFHPKGNIVLAGSEDSTLFMWNVKSSGADFMGVFGGHEQSVVCGGFTPNGKLVVSGSSDRSIRIWNPKDQTCVARISGYGFHDGEVTSISFKNDSTLIASGGQEGLVCVTNLITNKIVGTLRGHEESVESVDFSNSNQSFLCSGSLDSQVKVWDLNSMQLRLSCTGHNDGVLRVKSHPTAPLIISGSKDQSIKVWDERTGDCIKTLRGHQDMVLDFAVTNDGSKIVSGSDDKTALVFSLV